MHMQLHGLPSASPCTINTSNVTSMLPGGQKVAAASHQSAHCATTQTNAPCTFHNDTSPGHPKHLASCPLASPAQSTYERKREEYCEKERARWAQMESEQREEAARLAARRDSGVGG